LDDVCGLIRIGGNEAQVDNPSRSGLALPVDQFSVVAIKGQENPAVPSCEGEYVLILASGHDLSRCQGIVPCLSESPDACQRKVLVRQEPHLCGPETKGIEALVLERVRGKGEDRLETFRSQGGIVRQDLLLSPASAKKAEEEFNRETGTLHHGLASKDLGIRMDMIAPIRAFRLPSFEPRDIIVRLAARAAAVALSGLGDVLCARPRAEARG
jgi:hypothetical protein